MDNNSAENSNLMLEDKAPEKKMAELLGITQRALQAKRLRKQIPEGVWNRIGRRIIYSRRRYDEWLESQWIYPQDWKFVMEKSAFDSDGMASATLNHSSTQRRKRALPRHLVYAIK